MGEFTVFIGKYDGGGVWIVRQFLWPILQRGQSYEQLEPTKKINFFKGGVRAGIISSRAEWIEKVQSVEIPGYCAQIYGIDVDYSED